jgi:hypothetical protein
MSQKLELKTIVKNYYEALNENKESNKKIFDTLTEGNGSFTRFNIAKYTSDTLDSSLESLFKFISLEDTTELAKFKGHSKHLVKFFLTSVKDVDPIQYTHTNKYILENIILNSEDTGAAAKTLQLAAKTSQQAAKTSQQTAKPSQPSQQTAKPSQQTAKTSQQPAAASVTNLVVYIANKNNKKFLLVKDHSGSLSPSQSPYSLYTAEDESINDLLAKLSQPDNYIFRMMVSPHNLSVIQTYFSKIEDIMQIDEDKQIFSPLKYKGTNINFNDVMSFIFHMDLDNNLDSMLLSKLTENDLAILTVALNNINVKLGTGSAFNSKEFAPLFNMFNTSTHENSALYKLIGVFNDDEKTEYQLDLPHTFESIVLITLRCLVYGKEETLWPEAIFKHKTVRESGFSYHPKKIKLKDNQTSLDFLLKKSKSTDEEQTSFIEDLKWFPNLAIAFTTYSRQIKAIPGLSITGASKPTFYSSKEAETKETSTLKLLFKYYNSKQIFDLQIKDYKTRHALDTSEQIVQSAARSADGQPSAQSAPQPAAQSAPQRAARSAPQRAARSAPQHAALSAPQHAAQSALQSVAQSAATGKRKVNNIRVPFRTIQTDFDNSVDATIETWKKSNRMVKLLGTTADKLLRLTAAKNDLLLIKKTEKKSTFKELVKRSVAFSIYLEHCSENQVLIFNRLYKEELGNITDHILFYFITFFNNYAMYLLCKVNEIKYVEFNEDLPEFESKNFEFLRGEIYVLDIIRNISHFTSGDEQLDKNIESVYLDSSKASITASEYDVICANKQYDMLSKFAKLPLQSTVWGQEPKKGGTSSTEPRVIIKTAYASIDQLHGSSGKKKPLRLQFNCLDSIQIKDPKDQIRTSSSIDYYKIASYNTQVKTLPLFTYQNFFKDANIILLQESGIDIQTAVTNGTSKHIPVTLSAALTFNRDTLVSNNIVSKEGYKIPCYTYELFGNKYYCIVTDNRLSLPNRQTGRKTTKKKNITFIKCSDLMCEGFTNVDHLKLLEVYVFTLNDYGPDGWTHLLHAVKFQTTFDINDPNVASDDPTILKCKTLCFINVHLDTDEKKGIQHAELTYLIYGRINSDAFFEDVDIIFMGGDFNLQTDEIANIITQPKFFDTVYCTRNSDSNYSSAKELDKNIQSLVAINSPDDPTNSDSNAKLKIAIRTGQKKATKKEEEKKRKRETSASSASNEKINKRATKHYNNEEEMEEKEVGANGDGAAEDGAADADEEVDMVEVVADGDGAAEGIDIGEVPKRTYNTDPSKTQQYHILTELTRISDDVDAIEQFIESISLSQVAKNDFNQKITTLRNNIATKIDLNKDTTDTDFDTRLATDIQSLKTDIATLKQEINRYIRQEGSTGKGGTLHKKLVYSNTKKGGTQHKKLVYSNTKKGGTPHKKLVYSNINKKFVFDILLNNIITRNRFQYEPNAPKTSKQHSKDKNKNGQNGAGLDNLLMLSSRLLSDEEKRSILIDVGHNSGSGDIDDGFDKIKLDKSIQNSKDHIKGILTSASNPNIAIAAAKTVQTPHVKHKITTAAAAAAATTAAATAIAAAKTVQTPLVTKKPITPVAAATAIAAAAAATTKPAIYKYPFKNDINKPELKFTPTIILSDFDKLFDSSIDKPAKLTPGILRSRIYSDHSPVLYSIPKSVLASRYSKQEEYKITRINGEKVAISTFRHTKQSTTKKYPYEFAIKSIENMFEFVTDELVEKIKTEKKGIFY